MSEKPTNPGSDSKNEEKSEIMIEAGYRTRDLETQEEMDRMREEMRKENEEREENRQNSKELEDLKIEWSEKGGFLSEDKQNRLNELEDIVFKQKVKKEKTFSFEEGENSNISEDNEKRSGQEDRERLDDLISSASSLEELKGVLDKVGGITGSSSGVTNTADDIEELKSTAVEVKEGRWKMNSQFMDDYIRRFTRAHGLRDKVRELLEKEEKTSNGLSEKEKTEEQPEDVKELVDLIESGASEEEIKAKRDELLRKYHPDNEGGDVEKFIAINKAFESYKYKDRTAEGEPIPLESETEGAEVSQEKNKETLEERWKTLEEKRKKLVREKKSLQDAHKLGIQFTDEDLQEKFNKAETEYNETLADLRMAMLDEAGEGLSEEETRKKYEDILAETVSMEANRLEEAKLAVEMEEKSGSMAERTKNIGKKALNAYRKLPLRYKIGVSLALATGAGAVSGGVLAALLGGGIMVQRALGGAALGVVAGEGYRRVHERKASKEVLKEFGEGLAESIRGDQKALNEKILELQSRKGRERKKQYALGATVAFATAVLLPKAISNYLSGSEGEVITSAEGGAEGFPYEATPEGYDPTAQPEVVEGTGSSFVDKGEYGFDVSEAEKPGWAEEVGAVATIVGVEQTSAVENIFEVKAGSSVWETTEEYLKQNFGERFNGLNEGQQTHLIDQIKDRIAEDPSKFGMEGVDNIDIIQAGQKIDFSSIMKDGVINKIFESSEGLSQEAIDSIVENNETIAEWVRQNPGQFLTTEKVGEILANKASGFAGEATEAAGVSVGATESAAGSVETPSTPATEAAGVDPEPANPEGGTADKPSEAPTSPESGGESDVPEFLKEEARVTAEQEGGGETTREFNHEVATDFQKKIEFYERFREAFPDESQRVPEGRFSPGIMTDALLEGRITPEEFYDFLKDKITPNEPFPMSKEYIVEEIGKRSNLYQTTKEFGEPSGKKGLEMLVNMTAGYIK